MFHAAADGPWRQDVRHPGERIVLLEALNALDDPPGLRHDLPHELVAREPAVFDLAQLVFPLARHVGFRETLGLHRGKELQQRLRLGRRQEFALLAFDVFLIHQAVDRVGARAGVPSPRSFIASARPSSSTSLPAPSMADSSVASV